jgi:hypothetical protein
MKLARSSLFVLVALAALSPGSALAGSSVGTIRAQTAIDFAIVVPAMVRVKALVQPDRIAIGESDVARGYVDLDEASSLLLTSNGRGYHLSVAFDGSILERVRVRIEGEQFEIANGAGGVDVRAARLVDAPVRAGYRLFLKPGVQAGTYRWPVALAFSTRVVA